MVIRGDMENEGSFVWLYSEAVGGGRSLHDASAYTSASWRCLVLLLAVT